MAEVEDVTLVSMGHNHYDGQATVVAFHKSQVLNFRELDDGQRQTIQILTPAWQHLISSEIATGLTGQDSDVVLSPAFKRWLPATLLAPSTWKEFEQRLEVVSHVQHSPQGWLGSGCQKGSCNSDAAAWFFNPAQGQIYAVIQMSKGFQTYGASPSNLPAPLKKWASGNGMTAENSIKIQP